MAADLVGLRKHLNAKLQSHNIVDQVRHNAKSMIMDAVADWISKALRSAQLEQFIAEKIGEAAQAVGFNLTLTNIRDKAATRADVDAAVTAKINALAGTSFDTLRHVNREAVGAQVGASIGARLGVGPLYPVEAFRSAVGRELVASFDGGGNGLFSPAVTGAIESRIVAGWSELSEVAATLGNPMAKAGPPRDAAHAAKRAAGRKRQAKYRKRHYLHWVALGAVAASTGNGRAGLSGKASGNVKAVRNPGAYDHR